jgi:hypothetical protein
MVLPPPDWSGFAPVLADTDAEPDVAPVEVLSVPSSGLVVGLVDFCGDLVGDFFGVGDVLAEADEVPPRAGQLTLLEGDGEGLDGGGVVGPLVAGSDDAPLVDTTVLGLGGGLDAPLDETVGLDDVGGVELSAGLLVFGEVSCDAAGELVAPEQVGLGAASGADAFAAPVAL